METPRDEFQHQLSVLRGGILEYARRPSAVFPSLQFFGEFKKDDARLSAEISAAKDRISKAPAARETYSSARQRFDAAKTDYERAQKALERLYKPLGVAAFAAFKAGEIARQQQFAERMNLDERIARLNAEHSALAASPDSGIIGKGKAKAQQLALAARIKVEQLSAGRLEGQIGKELIDSQSEDSVRSASTDEVLDDVASARRDVASCKRDFDMAASALDGAKTALIQSLGGSNVDTDAAIDGRLGVLRWELTATELRLQDTENKFLDSMVSNAGSLAETPIGAALTRLAQLRVEARAAETRAAEARAVGARAAEQAALVREVKSMTDSKNERVGQGGDYRGLKILDILCGVGAAVALIAGIVVAVNVEHWLPFLAGLVLAFSLLAASLWIGWAIDIAKHTKDIAEQTRRTAIDLRELRFMAAELRGGKSPAENEVRKG